MIDFPQRHWQGCCGKDRKSDADWLAQIISTKIKCGLGYTMKPWIFVGISLWQKGKPCSCDKHDVRTIYKGK